MANVQFFKGTTIPTTSTLADGGIYFNTSNKFIYINNGGTLVSWDGNNSIVNNGKLTIQKNGNMVGTFTANASNDTVIDISVPNLMTGATSSSKGSAGFVPAPPAGANNSFLRGDGTWATLIGNPNLLVNGDFQIWQRGESFTIQDTTALNTSFYTADRWYMKLIDNMSSGDSYITKTFEGMYLNLWDDSLQFRQITEVPFSYGDDIYTLQISVNNIIYTTTFEESYKGGSRTLISGGSSVVSVELIEAPLTNESSTLGLQFNVSGFGPFTINWIKLEQGSSATPFTPKSYEEELAACKRYYQEIESLGPFLDKYKSESGGDYTTPQVYIWFDTMAHIPNITSIEVLYPKTDDLSAQIIEVMDPIAKNGFIASVKFNKVVKTYHAAIVTAQLDTNFDVPQ